MSEPALRLASTSSTHTHTRTSAEADRTARRPTDGGTTCKDTTRRRTELRGGGVVRPKKNSKWGNYHRRTLCPDQQNEQDRDCFWNRRAGVNGPIGEGGVFSNAVELIGEKSQFNKERWLPLCQEAQFNISHYCCSKIKKAPLKKYQTQNGVRPILATLAEESRIRKQGWIRTGCNALDSKDVKSTPMAFWTEQDILQYIVNTGLEICSVYGEVVSYDEEENEYDPHNLLIPGCKLKCTGCDRTGCIFCGFGFHLEKGETRFQRLARTHPRQYEYCMGGGQWVDNPAYDPTAPEYDGNWKNWNPKQIWVPSKKGLGMKYVFDKCNEIYGKDFYRYE